MNDDFRAGQIAETQNGILAHLAGSDADIAVKIAALRAAADLLTHAVSVAAMAAFFAAALTPKR